MNCAETGCDVPVEWTCLFHKIALCYPHWKKHNRICESKGILIEDAQLSKIEKIRNLNERVDLIQKQIVELGSKMIASINVSVSKALENLHEEQESLKNMILNCTTTSDMEKFLDLIPKELDAKQPNLALLKFRPSFDVKEFNLKVNKLDADLKLENMKNECRMQGIKLIDESLIQEIKLSRDTNFVFICKI